MNPLQKFVVLVVLLASVIGAVAVDRSAFLRENPEQIVVRPDSETRINWTEGFVTAQATVKLKRIASDRADAAFQSGEAERNLTDARSRARREAREIASLRIMRAFRFVRMDSSSGFLERMESDMAMRSRMGNLSSKILVASDRTGEGHVTIDVALPFHGEGGLFSLLADNRYGSDSPPESDIHPLADHITGILIDVSEYPDFIPALEPRVLSEEGRLLYGVETASRRCAVESGLASYFGRRQDAMRAPRLGTAPFYVFAAGISGAGRSDVFLDMDDVLRITGSEGGRRALKRCSVAFIVKKN